MTSLVPEGHWMVNEAMFVARPSPKCSTFQFPEPTPTDPQNTTRTNYTFRLIFAVTHAPHASLLLFVPTKVSSSQWPLVVVGFWYRSG